MSKRSKNILLNSVTLIALALVVWSLLLPSIAISIEIQNNRSEPVLVVVASAQASLVKGETCAPKQRARITVFTGEHPNDFYTMLFNVTAYDRFGNVVMEQRISGKQITQMNPIQID